MNDAISLLSKYKSRGISIVLDAGGANLSLKGQIRDLTDEDKNEIRSRKGELIGFLQEQKRARVLYSPITPVEPQKDYELSASQRRLWIVSQVKEVSVTYNMPRLFPLEGNYMPSLLRQAIEALVKHHEILRTVFRENGSGEVRQVILPSSDVPVNIDCHDLRDSADAQAFIDQYMRDDASRPFDLSAGPLFRMALFELGDGYRFYYNLHHTICDAWSLDVLARDLQKFYQACAEGASDSIEPLPLQYKDFTYWQKKYLQSPQAAIDREFWTSRFAGGVPVVDLPFQKKRPPVKTYNGHTLGIYFSEGQTAALRHFVQQENSSLYNALMVVLRALVYHYTGEYDSVIGTSVANREHVDLADQIGFYVNSLPLRSRLQPGAGFRSLLQATSAEIFEAFRHQQYPFDQIVEAVQAKRDISRNPLYDMILVLQNAAPAASAAPASEHGKVLDMGPVGSKMDISFVFQEMGSQLFLSATFNTDLYERGMMEKLLLHYSRLLSRMLEQPDAPFEEIDFLYDAEKEPLPLTALDKAGQDHITRLLPTGEVPVFFVLNQRMTCVPPGGTGEIYLQLSSIDATAGTGWRTVSAEQSFANAILAATGLYAHCIGASKASFLGDASQQVTIQGHRFSLVKLEQLLLQHPAIEDAALFAEEKNGETVLVAYILSPSGIQASEVRQHMKLSVPEYMVPSFFQPVESGFRKSDQTVDRDLLPGIQELEDLGGTQYVAPSGETEQKLVRIFEEVLEKKGIGVEDNFFEIGGDSIKATLILARIHQSFRQKVDMTHVFIYPTIRGFAEELGKLTGAGQPNEPEAPKPVALKKIIV